MEFYIKKDVEEIYGYDVNGVFGLVDEVEKGFFVMREGNGGIPLNRGIHLATLNEAHKFLDDEINRSISIRNRKKSPTDA